MPTHTLRRSLASVVAITAILAGSLIATSPAMADPGLPYPTGIVPADGAFSKVDNPDVHWDAVPGAASYTTRLSTTESGGNLTGDILSFPNQGTSIPGPLGESSFYWQVQSVDDEGNAGDWSPIRHFTVDLHAPSIGISGTAAAYKAGSTVPVTISASDNFNLKRVAANLYFNGSFLAAIGSTPAATSLATGTFGTTWNFAIPAGYADGVYTIKAAATDEAGWTSTTTTTFVYDTVRPVIAITSHAPNAVLHGVETIGGTATDTGSGISQVTFHLRAVKNTTPFSLNGFINTIVAPVVAGQWSLTLDTTAYADLGIAYPDPTAAARGYGFTVLGADAAGNDNGGGTALKPVTFDNTAPAGLAGTFPLGWTLTATEFTWTAATDLHGPVKYTVYKGNPQAPNADGSMSSGVEVLGSDLTGTSLAYAFPIGPIHWQVRATDVYGNSFYSPIYGAQVIGTPVITSPVDGTVFNEHTLTTTWTDVFGIGGVKEWQVDYFIDRNHDGHPTHEIRIVPGDQLSYTQLFLTYQGVETIRVRAVYNIPFSPWDASSDKGPWSNTVTVTRDSVGPIAPQPIAPQNGLMQNVPQPILGWNAAGDAVKYDVRTSHDPSRVPNTNNGALSGTSTTTRVTGTTFQLTAPGQGWTFWQVRGVDAVGNTGPWSNIWATGVDTVAPVVTLTAPLDGATVETADFSLTWSSSETPVTYTVQSSDQPDVDGNGALTHLIGISPVTTSDAFWALTGVPNATYYWQVRAEDAAGNTGAWTTPFTVTVAVPSPESTPASTDGGAAGAAGTGGAGTAGASFATEQLTTFALPGDTATTGTPSTTGSGTSDDKKTVASSQVSASGIAWWFWLILLLIAAALAGLFLIVFRRRQFAA
ncbi:hypothetical protein BH10ACT6_BH10ACT6_07320 [soil metagenome]